MIKEIEHKIRNIDTRLSELEGLSENDKQIERYSLLKEKDALLRSCKHLPPEDRVYLARLKGRPGITDYIDALFTDFFPQRGDRYQNEDPAILGGIALYKGTPVTVLGNRKGKNLDESKLCNFGMASPQGYRKAQRIMKQAEKFGRPIITFVDTSGAYPGKNAEETGQGEAIASSLSLMSSLTVPVISIITGEGGSGGALALAMGNKVMMLENAVYSILSPEGFSSILWKDPARADEACRIMKLTAEELLSLKVIDKIIPEPPGGAHRDHAITFSAVDAAISNSLREMKKISDYASHRYKKFRNMGKDFITSYRTEE